MPTVMERIFGAPKQAAPVVQEPLAQRNPGANPAAMEQQPNNTAANGNQSDLPQLDQFKDVWKNAPTDPNKPNDDSSPLINIDQKTLSEHVGKMDFLAGINPEVLTKATSGDVGAFAQAVNAAVQKALATQVALSGQLVEGAVSKNNERQARKLPNLLKETQVRETRSQNPVLQHEAAAPMLDTLKKQVMQSNPNLSAAEVHERAESMLTTFAQSLVGQSEKAKPKQKDATDFSDFL